MFNFNSKKPIQQKTEKNIITITDPLSELKLKIENTTKEINEILKNNVTLHHNKINSAKIYYLYSGVHYRNFGPHKFSDSCFVFNLDNDIKYILYREKIQDNDEDYDNCDDYSTRDRVFMTKISKNEFEEKLILKENMYRKNYDYFYEDNKDSPENLVVIDMINKSASLETMLIKGNISDLTNLYSALQNGKKDLLNAPDKKINEETQKEMVVKAARTEEKNIKQKEELTANLIFQSFKM